MTVNEPVPVTPLLGHDALRKLQREMVRDFYRLTPHDIAMNAWRAKGHALDRWVSRRRARPALAIALYRHWLYRPLESAHVSTWWPGGLGVP